VPYETVFLVIVDYIITIKNKSLLFKVRELEKSLGSPRASQRRISNYLRF
jgi:hypothetical protein